MKKAALRSLVAMVAILGMVAVMEAQDAPFRLNDGTPVRLRLERTLSSAMAEADERVDFQVLEDVSIHGLVVIPKGSSALGTVTEAQAKRRLGRGGKLDVELDSVRLADGEKCALSAVQNRKGGGHTGAMVGGMVATSLIAWPVAPVFLLMHGKDITIPKGTELTAYISGDMNLDPAKFESTPSTVKSASVNPPAASTRDSVCLAGCANLPATESERTYPGVVTLGRR